mmetsp:Transcript_132865/g.425210  ORF Transcript_132865/g.425210 Transcript_132865/m.425210 type:complete len:91 (+) Transcript_132865:383-655(+)
MPTNIGEHRRHVLRAVLSDVAVLRWRARDTIQHGGNPAESDQLQRECQGVRRMPTVCRTTRWPRVCEGDSGREVLPELAKQEHEIGPRTS